MSAASILAARKLAQYDGGKRVPATVSAIADAIRWAELITEEIDRRWASSSQPKPPIIWYAFQCGSEKNRQPRVRLELYCDDSGTDGNSPIAVAACYIASKVQWEEFVRNWDGVMRTEGFSYFHMAEFAAKPEAGQKPFCDWDNTKKSRVYGKLASIINTRARKGFGIAPLLSDHAPEHRGSSR